MREPLKNVQRGLAENVEPPHPLSHFPVGYAAPVVGVGVGVGAEGWWWVGVVVVAADHTTSLSLVQVRLPAAPSSPILQVTAG